MTTDMSDLDRYGCAVLPGLLTPAACRDLAALYPREEGFRSRVVMGRHGFGQGEYRYFSHPLPDPVQALRAALYPQLVDIANRWNETMGVDVRYPLQHKEFLAHCHAAGQVRPTPLLLQYGPGDYNCLHQTSTASTSSPCRSPSCCRSPARTSPAANLS